MATQLLDPGSGDVVELSSTDGVAFIEQASPLTRLHYFDGQFLRAASLTTEQDYHRHAVQLANLAGGWGVVNGFGIALSGDQLAVSAGLAVTPTGHFVLAGMDMKAKLTDLLGSAKPAPVAGSAAFSECLEAKATTTTATTGLQIYEITVGPVEGLCGNEAVFGKLCETACATDSRRPFWREGVVLRLRPISLTLPDSSAVKALTAHQRNRIASAYFAREPGQPDSLLSAAGLAGGVWCEPAQLYNRDEVVIGLLWREAGTVRIDSWSGRRERMDTQARGYWQGRMAMRPWNVFVAQILQFQCQLSGLFDASNPVILPGDDCGQIREVLSHARREIEAMLTRFGGSAKQILLKAEGKSSLQDLRKVSADFSASYADLNGLSAKLATIDTGSGALPQQRMLINAGFFELPPAGYLPVSTTSDVQEQCRRMFGEGCKLHFHAVRSDEIAHLVEEAEHMKRISLTRGLDDPKRLEEVEIFVPDGQVSETAVPSPGVWWSAEFSSNAVDALGRFMDQATPPKTQEPAPAGQAQPALLRQGRLAQGKALEDKGAVAQAPSLGMFGLGPNGLVHTAAGADGSFTLTLVADILLASSDPKSNQGPDRLVGYLAIDLPSDPFALAPGTSMSFRGEGAGVTNEEASEFQLQGRISTPGAAAAGPAPWELKDITVEIQADGRSSKDGSSSSDTATWSLFLRRNLTPPSPALIVEPRGQQGGAPFQVDWQTDPLQALISEPVQQAQFRDQVVRQRMRQLAAGLPQQAFENRDNLVRLTGLPAMPDPESPLGVFAINAITAIAALNTDTTLLTRAKLRLFPSLQTPKTQNISALLDWVCFRRARTHLCGPACATQAATALETFRVWHLKADSPEIVNQLRKALDSGSALDGFKFQRVGLLRYRDESAFSEETADQVLQMWKLAQPNPVSAVLGRVWEAAPTAGQGWQNHMRLRHMLEQIDSQIKAPPVGDGSLAAMTPPAGELGDKTVDGGMLVVTLPLSAAAHTHRVVLVKDEQYQSIMRALQQSPLAAFKALSKLVSQPSSSFIDLDVHFASGQLLPADADALQKDDKTMRLLANPTGGSVTLRAFRFDVQNPGADVHPADEEQVIAKILGMDLGATDSATGVNANDGNASLQTTDLGRGAQVLSLIGYRAQGD